MPGNRRRALEVHGRISTDLRLSTLPIIYGVPKVQIVHHLNGDCFLGRDRFETALARRHQVGAWCSAGDLTKACLQLIPASPNELAIEGLEQQVRRWRDTGIGDHETLTKMLRAGSVPEGWPLRPDPVSPRAALDRAKELGYTIPPYLMEVADSGFSERNLWEASYEFVRRRWSKDIVHLASQFIIPDPLERTKVPYIVNQLWIVRTEGDVPGLRFLALQVDTEDHLRTTASRRDQTIDVLLTERGIECYRVGVWWLAVDSPRGIWEFVRSAAFPVSGSYSVDSPRGRSIESYQCAVCGEVMIRDPDGWGMIRCKDTFVHEGECYDNALADS